MSRPRPKLRRRELALLAGVCALLAAAIQLLPVGAPRDNPPVVAEPAWDSPRTRELFVRACADCHSNQTRWPWYSRVAPASWLVAHDVAEGRRELNVSEWQRPQEHAHESAQERPAPLHAPPLATSWATVSRCPVCGKRSAKSSDSTR